MTEMAQKISCRLNLRVQPGARQSEVARFEHDTWHIRIAAPPVEGKANLALIAFLSGKLDVPRSCLAITRGLSSRNKTVVVTGLDAEQTAARLKLI